MLSKLVISTAGRKQTKVFQHNHKTLSTVAGRDTAALGALCLDLGAGYIDKFSFVRNHQAKP